MFSLGRLEFVLGEGGGSGERGGGGVRGGGGGVQRCSN